jgi:hypothetical protein
MQAEFTPLPWLSPADAASSSPAPPARRRLFSAAATVTAEAMRSPSPSPSRAATKTAIIKSPAAELSLLNTLRESLIEREEGLLLLLLLLLYKWILLLDQWPGGFASHHFTCRPRTRAPGRQIPLSPRACPALHCTSGLVSISARRLSLLSVVLFGSAGRRELGRPCTDI